MQKDNSKLSGLGWRDVLHMAGKDSMVQEMGFYLK